MEITKAYFDAALKSLVTKQDFDAALKNFGANLVTKEDAKNFATKDDLKSLVTKEDAKNFATKDDLKDFATKHDLKNGLASTENRIIQYVDRRFIESEDKIMGITARGFAEIRQEMREMYHERV